MRTPAGPRQADAESEKRLAELCEEARRKGRVEAAGIRPEGAPFPKATAETGYYGLPLLKPPTWTWEVPAYFFVGGAAGAAAIIAAAARRSGDSKLARRARLLAAIGGVLSPALLTSDLGRPKRFPYMLRVFKPRSPMSVGAWTLAAFGSSAAAALVAGAARERGVLPRLAHVVETAGEGSAAAIGLVMATYTGVLIGATAIPVWAENAALLPPHFGASGLASAASILELSGASPRPLHRLGIAAAAAETAVGAVLEGKRRPAVQPARSGVSGLTIRAGGVLSGPLPLALRLLFPRSQRARRLAALSSLAGSLLTRFGWVAAGHASAKNPMMALDPHVA